MDHAYVRTFFNSKLDDPCSSMYLPDGWFKQCIFIIVEVYSICDRHFIAPVAKPHFISRIRTSGMSLVRISSTVVPATVKYCRLRKTLNLFGLLRKTKIIKSLRFGLSVFYHLMLIDRNIKSLEFELNT